MFLASEAMRSSRKVLSDRFMDMEDLARGISNLRNLVIARVFFELGLIEQWGSGIQRIIDECNEHGLQKPVFEEIGMRFRMTIFTSKQTAPLINELDQNILLILKREGNLSTSELAKHINWTFTQHIIYSNSQARIIWRK